MVGERGKGEGKVGQRSSSRNAGQATEIMDPAVVPTSAAVLTLESVPPLPGPPAEHDAGALEASLTLASLSMPVLAAGVLVNFSKFRFMFAFSKNPLGKALRNCQKLVQR